jgi:hypothetical protein
MHKDQLSVSLGTLLTRTAIALIAVGALAVGCGGGGGGDDEGLEGPVAAGFFVGTTDEGEPMSIQADSIRAIFISCGGTGFEYFALYDPPEPISVNGDFAVNVVSGLRFLSVSGSFISQNRVQGTISGDPFCNGDFDLRRCNPDDPKCQDKTPENNIPDGIQPTPTATLTATPTPEPTATSTAATPTSTVSGVTPTAPTPTTSPTPDATELCGNGIIDTEDAEECDGNDLGGATCVSEGHTGGTLTCDDCSFDEEGCTDE